MDIGEHWRDICHAIQEGVFIVDPQGRIIMANDAMTRLTGYTQEELAGQRCALFGCDTCARERASVQGAWCPLFAGRGSQAKRCHIRRKDGTLLPVFKNQSLIHDAAGKVMGAVESVLDLTELDRLDRKVETLARLLDRTGAFHGMVGASPTMNRLYDILEKAARSDAPVLLLGESGSGKELAARAIHELGGRSTGPFVQLNCAALNESLLESELFGHAKGAFTGAHRQRQGRFEAADGGDIFLDEIGDAPLSIQVKLLRVLETKTVERVGENKSVPVDVRLIAATHQNLPALIEQGRFRQDFYFRINVIPIELPPLRERMEDIPLLCDRFVEKMNALRGRAVSRVGQEAMALLLQHDFPGNIRELENIIEHAFVLCHEGEITVAHLPAYLLRRESNAAAPQAAPPSAGPPPSPIALQRQASEEEAILAALREHHYNRLAAARALGIHKSTLFRKLKKLNIALPSEIDGRKRGEEG